VNFERNVSFHGCASQTRTSRFDNSLFSGDAISNFSPRIFRARWKVVKEERGGTFVGARVKMGDHEILRDFWERKFSVHHRYARRNYAKGENYRSFAVAAICLGRELSTRKLLSVYWRDRSSAVD